MRIACRCALASVALLLSLVVLTSAPVALAKTSKSLESCELSTGSVKSLLETDDSVPVELSSPLEAGVLSQFAVLRRAALPSDQIPALSPVGGEVDGELVSYYPGYVRQVKVLPNGSRYFLIPGFAKPQSVPPARCLSASQRRERPQLVEQEHKLAAEPVYCIVELGHESTGSSCEPFATIEQSPRVFQPSLSEEAIVELAPDGVSSVRATYVTGPPVVATVEENVYMLAVPKAVRARAQKRLKKVVHRLERAKHATKAEKRRAVEELLKGLEHTLVEVEPHKVEWLSSTGGLVRSIAPSKSSAIVGVNLPNGVAG
jgi:hypothetical protein